VHINNKKKAGPKPDAIKIDGDWQQAMGKAMKKKRPVDGWPSSKVTEKTKKS